MPDKTVIQIVPQLCPLKDLCKLQKSQTVHQVDVKVIPRTHRKVSFSLLSKSIYFSSHLDFAWPYRSHVRELGICQIAAVGIAMLRS